MFQIESMNDNYRLSVTFLFDMGEYKGVFPYFGKSSGKPKYKEGELIAPMLIERVPDNLFIGHDFDPLFLS